MAAAAVALLCAASGAAAREAASAAVNKDWRTPRTEHGHPDLQGVWTNATITPLERPDRFGDRLVITEDEARELEGAEAAYNEAADAPSDLTKPAPATCRSGSGPTCGYNNFWIDRGSQVATVNGERRSSLIVGGNIWPSAASARASMGPKRGRSGSAACWRSARAQVRRCCRCSTTTTIRSCRRRIR